MGFMQGRRVLITGVANECSIAWGIAKAMAREGAQIALTYQSPRVERNIRSLAAEVDCRLLLECDLTNDEAIERIVQQIEESWGAVDVIVHSVAYAPRSELAGDLLSHSTRKGFHTAMDASVYSLIALAQAAKPLLQQDSALLTISYLGARRAVPHYNVMGIAKAALESSVRYLANDLGPLGVRVNAISAGPIKTLAAKGIADFGKFHGYAKANAPLRRTVDIDEVGNAAAFLCSTLASGITGETLYVDAGYHITAMTQPEQL